MQHELPSVSIRTIESIEDLKACGCMCRIGSGECREVHPLCFSCRDPGAQIGAGKILDRFGIDQRAMHYQKDTVVFALD